MFKIIISPAKQLKNDVDGYNYQTKPLFVKQAKVLFDILKSKTQDELKSMLKINNKLAKKSYDEFQNFSFDNNLVPAILSFNGIQYLYMRPNIFTFDEIKYVQEHLYIMSAMYGLLKPLDGINPYRLELGLPFSGNGFDNLYEYWRPVITTYLNQESDTILNLTSFEYTKLLKNHLSDRINWIDVKFLENHNSKLVEKAVHVKMMRGLLVSFLAKNNITSIDKIKEFSDYGFKYNESKSSKKCLVFTKIDK